MKNYIIALKSTDEERPDDVILESGADDVRIKPFGVKLDDIIE